MRPHVLMDTLLDLYTSRELYCVHCAWESNAAIDRGDPQVTAVYTDDMRMVHIDIKEVCTCNSENTPVRWIDAVKCEDGFACRDCRRMVLQKRDDE